MKKQKFNSSVFADKDMLLNVKKEVYHLTLQNNKILVDKGFGEHISPFKTKGLDFQEVRVYQPGDDIRLIDWKITAKHNRPYTKLYADEKERQVFLIIDMRSHMKFASHGFFKSLIAARSSMFLSFLAENKNDKIGFCVLADETFHFSQPQAAHETILALAQILEECAHPTQLTFPQNTLDQVLKKSEHFIKQGASVFILSDFSDFSDATYKSIQRLSKKSVCSLLHIFDTFEKKLPHGVFPITNGENIYSLDTKQSHFDAHYSQNFQLIESHLLNLAKNERIGYLPLETNSPYINALTFYCKGGLIS